MIILKIAAVILLVLLACLLILLLIPLRYSAQGYKYEDYNVTACVSWIFGILKLDACIQEGRGTAFSVKLFNHPLRISQKKNERKKEKVKEKAKKQSLWKRFLDIGYRNQFFKMITNIINHVKPSMISASGRFGFDDPFDTAVVWGFLSSINITGGNISISPVFDEEILKGEFKIAGRVALISLLMAYVVFRFSKPVKYILKNERMEKKYVS